MMYANYFNKPKKNNSNILRFKPPGFKHSIDFPFPGRSLAVCARCKKNYKTREHCRVKEGHTGLPWTETYLCITLDPTCTGPDGKILDGPFLAQPAPSTTYQYAGTVPSNTPSCGPCKEKNYTKTYCRTSKRHKHLPWATVYVVLTLRQDGAIPPPEEEVNAQVVQEMNAKRRKVSAQSKKATNVPSELDPVDNNEKEGGDPSAKITKGENGDDDGKDDVKRDNNNNDDATDADNVKNDTAADDDDDENEEDRKKRLELDAARIFEEVPTSRTFLATISVHKCKIEWLDYDSSQPVVITGPKDKEELIITKVIKDQPDVQVYPQYAMMPPPMGMSPMMMNPYAPPPPMHSATTPNGGENGTTGTSGNGTGEEKSESHGSWSVPPPTTAYPIQQDMMYQTQMGFAYAFPPPAWPGAAPPMNPSGMTPYDGSQSAPMMHQMGWGGGNFYAAGPMPPPPQHMQQHVVQFPAQSMPMPQSYEGELKVIVKSPPKAGGEEAKKVEQVDQKVKDESEI